MSKLLILVFFSLFLGITNAQIDGDALFSLPALTGSELATTTNVKEGSLVYNSDDQNIYKYNGTIWEPLGQANQVELQAGTNISVSGSGTAADPYIISTPKTTLTNQNDGTFLFSNGVDADVAISVSAPNVPIVSSSNAGGNCTNHVGQNQTRDVVIQGDFFDGSATVSITGQTINTVTINSVNQITANVTASSVVGDYDITVTTNNGTSTLPNGFSITEAKTTYSYGTSDMSLSDNMTYSGGVLSRTNGSGWNRGGYSTAYSIPSDEDGYLEYTLDTSNRNVAVGINSDPTTNDSFNSIDFAIHHRSNGTLRIYENGTRTNTLVSYVVGDVFRIEKNCLGNITYAKNGVVFFTSNNTTNQPLFFDSSFNQSPGAISGIVISY